MPSKAHTGHTLIFLKIIHTQKTFKNCGLLSCDTIQSGWCLHVLEEYGVPFSDRDESFRRRVNSESIKRKRRETSTLVWPPEGNVETRDTQKGMRTEISK